MASKKGSSPFQELCFKKLYNFLRVEKCLVSLASAKFCGPVFRLTFGIVCYRSCLQDVEVCGTNSFEMVEAEQEYQRRTVMISLRMDACTCL